MGQLLKTVGLCALELAPALSRAANLTGLVFPTANISGDMLIILSSGAPTGGTTTLDVKLQGSSTSGGTYADISGAAFAQVSAAVSFQTLILKDDSTLPAFIKVIGTIGAGSTTVYSVVALTGKLDSLNATPTGS